MDIKIEEPEEFYFDELDDNVRDRILQEIKENDNEIYDLAIEIANRELYTKEGEAIKQAN
jgi:hypothetical protein